MHWNRGTRNPVGPSHRVIKLASWLVCATVAIGLAPAGRANTVVFATGSQTPLGVAVDASATFDINTNSITVTLLNLIDPLQLKGCEPGDRVPPLHHHRHHRTPHPHHGDKQRYHVRYRLREDDHQPNTPDRHDMDNHRSGAAGRAVCGLHHLCWNPWPDPRRAE